MGTLTADTPALEEHCRHKLPTSCRLTATPRCCACLDRRPHSTAYSTYIDGVGLTLRATRWQKYCWFCQQFWNNRIASVRPSIEFRDTSVPDEPDQTEFLGRWHDFHRGFRLVTDPDNGSDSRQPVWCEIPWRDVAPGHLPISDPASRQEVSRVVFQTREETEHVSLESTLDDLIANAEDEIATDGPLLSGTTFAQVVMWDQENSRNIPDAALEESQARVTRARHIREEKVAELEAAALDVERARDVQASLCQEVNEAMQETRLQRQRHALLLASRRTVRNLEHVFGTREQIQQQGSSYESPLTTMFVRAYDRYRVAEEVRAEERLVDHNLEYQSQRGVSLPPFMWGPGEAQREHEPASPQARTLDNDDVPRPPPLADEDMMVRLNCRICLQQKADVATLPCGHLIMCRYCSDIMVPTKQGDSSQPAHRSAACALCKKTVKKVVHIFTT